MTKLLSFMSMVVLLLVVVLLPAILEPEWARDLGLDTCDLDLPGVNLLGADRRAKERAEWDKRQQLERRRAAAKEQVVKRLLDRRLGLFEAAATFRCLNEEYPPSPPGPEIHGDSEEERTCRQVIQWVSVELYRSHPESRDAEIVRLGEELRRHKERYGTVILPDDTEIRAPLTEGERGDWQRLWDEVAALRQQAQPKEK